MSDSPAQTPHSELFDLVRRGIYMPDVQENGDLIVPEEISHALARIEEQLEAVRAAAIPVVNKLIDASNGSGLVVTKEELNALRDALASSPASRQDG